MSGEYTYDCYYVACCYESVFFAHSYLMAVLKINKGRQMELHWLPVRRVLFTLVELNFELPGGILTKLAV